MTKRETQRPHSTAISVAAETLRFAMEVARIERIPRRQLSTKEIEQRAALRDSHEANPILDFSPADFVISGWAAAEATYAPSVTAWRNRMRVTGIDPITAMARADRIEQNSPMRTMAIERAYSGERAVNRNVELARTPGRSAFAGLPVNSVVYDLAFEYTRDLIANQARTATDIGPPSRTHMLPKQLIDAEHPAKPARTRSTTPITESAPPAAPELLASTESGVGVGS